MGLALAWGASIIFRLELREHPVPSRHVLIIEDHPEARQMLQGAISTLGEDVRVTAVPSGEEALLLITHQRIDLLIVDIRLPGMSGFDLVERARNYNNHIEVILITGVEEEGVRQRVQQFPAAAYFFKPLQIENLLQAVQACLRVNEGSEAAKQEEGPRVGFIRQTLEGLAQRLGAESATLWDGQGRLKDHIGLQQAPSLPSWVLEEMRSFEKPTLRLDEEALTTFCCLRRSWGWSVFLAFSFGYLLGLEFRHRETPLSWEALFQLPWIEALKEIVLTLQDFSENNAPPIFQEKPVKISGLSSSTEGRDLESLFDEIAQNPIDSSEAEAFWEAASQESLSFGRNEPPFSEDRVKHGKVPGVEEDTLVDGGGEL